MNPYFNALLTIAGLCFIAYGVLAGVHEDAYIGLGCIALSCFDGLMTATFNRLDTYLQWISGGAIKPKRTTL